MRYEPVALARAPIAASFTPACAFAFAAAANHPMMPHAVSDAARAQSQDGQTGLSIVTFVAPEDIRSPSIRQLHSYWERKRVSGALPAKTDIDPSEIKPLLPYVSIVEIHHAPLRVHFRLVGTEIVQASTFDFTDAWVPNGNWGEQIESAILSVYRELVERRAPLFGIDDLIWVNGRRQRYEWGQFPLSSDGATVTHAIGLEDQRSITWD
jgi:hypothetical protein